MMLKRRTNSGIIGGCLALAAVLSAAPDRTETIMLSGASRADAVPWEFRTDAGRRSGEWTTIAVPSCWEQEGFGTYSYGQVEAKLPRTHAVYRRTFTLPELAGRHVRLCFEGVMTDAAVTVNGQSAGPVHQGGFSPFHYDVRALVHPGENRIEVAVSDQSDDPGISRSERYADFWLFGGIHRPVYLQLLPAGFVDRVAIDARADRTLRLEVFVGAASGADRVTAQLVDAQGRRLGAPLETALPPGADHVRLEGKFADAALWTPETPNLYRVEVTLARGSQALHRITERCGFRTFEVVKDGGFRLNGKRVILKGVCRPSFRPDTGRTFSREDSVADVKLMKAMNANAVRAVHYPCDRHFLYACDELGLMVMTEYLAWMSPLPDEPGKRLVKELVTRDQNHPSIVLWANGNHRSFNPVLEHEFKVWDLQDRQAVRTEPKITGSVPPPARADRVPVDTRMYPSYAQLTERLSQPWPVLPVESLHALYDGGGGAGLAEYWTAIEASPVGGGLFIWEFVDEAIARTDRDGELDSRGNASSDGLVGPHHEREAGFFAARDIWSPVQVTAADLGAGRVTLRNQHLVADLTGVTFVRQLVKATEPVVRESQGLESPRCAPGATAALDLRLPANAGEFDYVTLEAYGTDGELLRDWSWPLRDRASYLPSAAAGGDVTVAARDGRLEVRAGGVEMTFDATTARLLEVKRNGAALPLRGGPDLAWSSPPDNVLPEHLRDGVARVIAPADERKKAPPASQPGRLGTGSPRDGKAAVRRLADGGCEISTTASRGFERLTWTISGDGTLQLDYAYRLDGRFDSFGISFDSDKAAVRSVTWLGDGPHQGWRNRRDGVHYGLWTKSDTGVVPGRSFGYPTFEGCHANTVWLRLETAAGPIRVWLKSPGLVARWFTPEWGAAPLNATAALPPGDISFLHVMPGIGEKWMPAADLGPAGHPVKTAGRHAGALVFRFE